MRQPTGGSAGALGWRIGAELGTMLLVVLLVSDTANFTRARADAAAGADDAGAADAGEAGAAREAKAWQYQLYVDGAHDVTIGCGALARRSPVSLRLSLPGE